MRLFRAQAAGAPPLQRGLGLTAEKSHTRTATRRRLEQRRSRAVELTSTSVIPSWPLLRLRRRGREVNFPWPPFIHRRARLSRRSLGTNASFLLAAHHDSEKELWG